MDASQVQPDLSVKYKLIKLYSCVWLQNYNRIIIEFNQYWRWRSSFRTIVLICGKTIGGHNYYINPQHQPPTTDKAYSNEQPVEFSLISTRISNYHRFSAHNMVQTFSVGTLAPPGKREREREGERKWATTRVEGRLPVPGIDPPHRRQNIKQYFVSNRVWGSGCGTDGMVGIGEKRGGLNL